MCGKFMVDFRLTDYPVIIQCDGTYWHDRPRTRSRDRGQDRYLTKAGYIVLRFNDHQILHEVQSCILAIRQAIRTGQLALIHY